MTKEHKAITFSVSYRTRCKFAWYAAGRVDNQKNIMDIIPLDEYGRKPAFITILSWRNDDGWDVWADEMDAQAEIIAEDALINQRVKMLKEQASLGRELQMKGIGHLREHSFDTSSSAVAAIKLGVDVERAARGISERLLQLAKLSDEALKEETQKLLDRAMESGEIIDVADVEKEQEKEEVEEEDA